MDGTDGKGQLEALGTKFADQKARVTPAEEVIILWSDPGPGGRSLGFTLHPDIQQACGPNLDMASLGPNVHFETMWVAWLGTSVYKLLLPPLLWSGRRLLSHTPFFPAFGHL